MAGAAAGAATAVRLLNSTTSALRHRPSNGISILRLSSRRLPKPLSFSASSLAAPVAVWPEWQEFLEKLRRRGYFEKVSDAEGKEETGSASEEYRTLKAVCLAFARERPDILRSLPRKDIQAIVGCGCPNVHRKTVNSAKRLREYVNLDEGRVCGACSLRKSCDRAYLLAKKDEGARTVDIIRILLQYAAQILPETSGYSQLQDTAQDSARRLLSELTSLCDTEPDPELLKAVIPQKREETHQIPRVNLNRKTVELKRGDWICTQCSFTNYARNIRCRECKADKPMREEPGKPEMRTGDWTCPQCSFMNFARNTSCLECDANRPIGMGPARSIGMGLVEPEMRKGDWSCPQCNFMNFGRNASCLECKADKPIGVEPFEPEMGKGDWSCLRCNFMNFARNTCCLECKADKPVREEPEIRKGDWPCPQCQFVNFARNIRCLECKAYKPMKDELGKHEMKRGDWPCPECQFINFASHKECRRCQERRPERVLEPGEWECPSCDFLNFQRNDKCRKCKCERPKDSFKNEDGIWSEPKLSLEASRFLG